MGIQIYNTLTRKKEPLETLEPGVVRMYVCGPTVYADAHIGHGMSSLVFDGIRRYLEFRGYRVIHAMNFTDVDDKIILRAREEGGDPAALAERHIAAYFRHLEALNVLPPILAPRATRDMDQILMMISRLIESGHAYAAGGDVYFRVESFPGYGRLSGRLLAAMRSGTRISASEYKENPIDFALWKAAKPGEPAWDSPWGRGRPGWHIECSAMNLEHLGEQIDIHGGGSDLVFPHHENEIAQTESLTGKPFARYWVHNGMLQFSGEKMSKSLGNVVTLSDFLARYEGDVLRMLVLNSSYRSPLTYSDAIAAQAERALERLRSALRPADAARKGAAGEVVDALNRQAELARAGFIQAMDDDFNTAGALGHLFELVRAIHQARDQGAAQSQLQPAQAALAELTGVLGLEIEKKTTRVGPADPFIDLLVSLRGELRAQKLWALSDQVRDRLAELGVAIEDGREGARWKWK
jgi:cysteinyl-tRNA synthetase